MSTIADLLMAAVGGNHPMGGHQIYSNEWPSAPPPAPQPPPAWLPPGFGARPGAPVLEEEEDGPVYRPPPDPSYMFGPRFKRINPAPRENWRDIET